MAQLKCGNIESNVYWCFTQAHFVKINISLAHLAQVKFGGMVLFGVSKRV